MLPQDFWDFISYEFVSFISLLFYQVFTFLHCLQSLHRTYKQCLSFPWTSACTRGWALCRRLHLPPGQGQAKRNIVVEPCKDSCSRGSPFNILPVSSCQCLQNLEEFNYLQGFYLSIELDWSKPVNFHMVKEGKVWQRGLCVSFISSASLSKKIELNKVWYFEKYKSIWTIMKFFWLWKK